MGIENHQIVTQIHKQANHLLAKTISTWRRDWKQGRPMDVSTALRTVKDNNGQKLFTPDKYLTSRQIKFPATFLVKQLAEE